MPPSKELLTVEATLAKAEVSLSIYDPDTKAAVEQLIRDLDTAGNNDNHLCSKQFKPNAGQDKQWGADDYVITQIGTTNRAASLRVRPSSSGMPHAEV